MRQGYDAILLVKSYEATADLQNVSPVHRCIDDIPGWIVAVD